MHGMCIYVLDFYVTVATAEKCNANAFSLGRR